MNPRNVELPPLESPDGQRPRGRRTRKHSSQERSAHSMAAQGEHLVWLSGGSLVLAMAMIVGLFGLILVQGTRTFWPGRIVRIERHGEKPSALGEVISSERYRLDESARKVLPEDEQQRLASAADNTGAVRRRRVRVETKELGDVAPTYEWISDFEVKAESGPDWACLIERTTGGRLYGELLAFEAGEERVADEPSKAFETYQRQRGEVESLRRQIETLKSRDLGRLSEREEAARLAERKAGIDFGAGSSQATAAKEAMEKIQTEIAPAREEIEAKINELTQRVEQSRLVLRIGDGTEAQVPLATIVRVVPANRLSGWQSLGVYFSRWGEFLFGEPRNANTEGGVLPAIWGTVAMTLIMSIAVAPFGVLAALYLREYAKAGWIVSAIRIAINNLAGVPSIVFGVFGLGFFCYNVGSFIDGGPANIGVAPLPPRLWYGYLFALAACAFAGFASAIFGVTSPTKEDAWWRKTLRYVGPVIWVAATLLLVYTIITAPYFKGFFYAKLPDPTFGKGGVLWAALTLSLLTLPVVIVATEEALSAVPNSMREGSYACGAGKWQTIRRIVLPHALPGIITGMILAMARGAGEAAPLMLVGAVSSAPRLPLDGTFPWLHADRSFMHLAYLILFLGFQSTDSEAAQPMVFTTALLLLTIVIVLNVASIWLRSRLKKAFQASHF